MPNLEGGEVRHALRNVTSEHDQLFCDLRVSVPARVQVQTVTPKVVQVVLKVTKRNVLVH